MSKEKTKSANISKKGGNISKAVPFDEAISKYFWLVIPVLTVAYYYYRNISVGFYQDDEIGQYINMVNFWHDPGVILGNGPKPGYKIFMVVPALLGYNYVLIVNALIASVTVYMTYVLLRTYKLNYAVIGALLLASQPMFIELSFRSYSEIFTALLFVSFLILFRKEKYLLSALLLGYIFTVRQESALLIAIMAVLFARDKKFTSVAALFVFPLIYTLLGFWQTGDLFFIITQMKSVAGLNYKSQGLFHYFRVYIFIVGPICLSLFLLGFFGFLRDTKNIKQYLKDYMLFYIIFTVIFITQMLTMINDGPNPGNWRYLLHVSPICAAFAVIGLNNLASKDFKKISYYLIGALLVLVLLFLSKTTDGFQLLDKQDYTKFVFVLAFLIFTILLWSERKFDYLNKLAIAAVLLAFVHVYFGLTPKMLSPENVTVKETAGYVDGIQEIQSREKLSNHTLLQFYSTAFKNKPESFKKLDLKNLDSAPKGTIVVWESHYGYRPEFMNDVKFETISQDSIKYKLLKENISADKRFYSFVFEKQ